MVEILYDYILDIGNQGWLTSFALTARSIVPSLKSDMQFIAIIPKSVKVPHIGWVPDVIGFADLRSKMTREEKETVMNYVFYYFILSFFYHELCRQ